MVAEGYELRNPALYGDTRRRLEGFLDAWQSRLEGRLWEYLAQRRCLAELAARRGTRCLLQILVAEGVIRW